MTEVHESLRRGDLAAARGATAGQQAQADALRAAGQERAAAAAALAREVGLGGDAPTLAEVAARVPEPRRSEFLAARDRLAALAAEVAAVQARNANLVAHLRSYFRGIVTELKAPGVPLRYGPSGGRVEPSAGYGVRASG